MERLPENPVISPCDVVPSRPDFEVAGVFNAGVARFGGEVLLLLRVAESPRERRDGFAVAPIWRADRREIELFSVRRDDPEFVEQDARLFRYRGSFYLPGISHLRLARSTDGVHFTVDETPTLAPEAATESYGIEDPRITQMDSDYWITYKAVSENGIATALAHTRDFNTYTRHGLIFCPENLDVVIFPEKLGDRYAAWTRPVGRCEGTPAIWTATSPDLANWGGHKPVMHPRRGLWDSGRVGAGAVPFRTSEGWLEIYHGADTEDRYYLGAALIDADDPSKILARSREPLLAPEAHYETEGFFGNVVFSCGVLAETDGSVIIYYGASDESTCAARTSVDEILAGLV